MSEVQNSEDQGSSPEARPLWAKVARGILFCVIALIAAIIIVVILAAVFPTFKGRVMARATFIIPARMRPFMVQRLEKLGKPAEAGLIDILDNHGSWDVRREAADTLGIIHDNSPMVRAALIRTALDDPEANVRAQAIWALGCIEAKDLAPTYVKLLADENQRVRKKAAEAISLQESIDPKLVKALVNTLLTNRDWQVSMLICEDIIRKHHKEVPEFRDALIKASELEDEDVSEVAKEVLEEINQSKTG